MCGLCLASCHWFFSPFLQIDIGTPFFQAPFPATLPPPPQKKVLPNGKYDWAPKPFKATRTDSERASFVTHLSGCLRCGSSLRIWYLQYTQWNESAALHIKYKKQQIQDLQKKLLHCLKSYALELLATRCDDDNWLRRLQNVKLMKQERSSNALSPNKWNLYAQAMHLWIVMCIPFSFLSHFRNILVRPALLRPAWRETRPTDSPVWCQRKHWPLLPPQEWRTVHAIQYKANVEAVKHQITPRLLSDSVFYQYAWLPQ